MSIQTNPSKAVPTILKLLEQTIEKKISDPESRKEMNKTIEDLLDQFPRVKHWNDELLEKFLMLDRYRRCAETKTGDNLPFHSSPIQRQLRDINQLLLKFNNVAKKNDDDDDDTDDDVVYGANRLRALSKFEQDIVTHAENPIVKSLRVSYNLLDSPNLKVCLLFLAIFPEKAVLKKKLVIYWWIGEGLVRDKKEGKEVFSELLKLKFIKPYRTDKCPRVSKFQIHPWIRFMLITVGIEQNLLDLERGKPCFDPFLSLRACLIPKRADFEGGLTSTWDSYLMSIYNVSAVYLNVKPETLAKFKKLVVLQLGRWQLKVPHSRQIQVLGDSFLLGLNTQKQLKYLSLRGMSRIFKIPDSITDLASLEILDLKACHNLETLPRDISPLKKLTHLDVSQCYMLERMPKGLEKLTSLQVLDGFIIGNSHKNIPFKINHFLNLTKLKKLGIHIARGPYLPMELHRLKDLGSVTCLKISWGSVTEKDDEVSIKRKMSDSGQQDRILTFPAALMKLKLEGIPYFSRCSEWMKPNKLKKLYIKGGKISSLFDEEADPWKVEVLILKYMKGLKTDKDTLLSKIGSLKYVKKVDLKDDSSDDGESIDFEWPDSLPL